MTCGIISDLRYLHITTSCLLQLESSKMSFWSRKTFCIVSGASRGFGASLAKNFSIHLAPGSLIVLLARDLQRLNGIKQEILIQRTDIHVFTWDVDFVDADAELLKKRFADLFAENEEYHPCRFHQCIIVHNIGSLGNVEVPFTGLLNKKEIDEYWQLNLTSVILLNSVFFGIFAKSVISKRYVVHISSMCAFKPIKYWGLYCGGKAARDMLFNVMSAEEEDVRILSYAPGPLKTDMFHEAIVRSGHPETKNLFQEMEKNVLSCDQSAEKLVNILKDDRFESGCHIDYYDSN